MHAGSVPQHETATHHKPLPFANANENARSEDGSQRGVSFRHLAIERIHQLDQHCSQFKTETSPLLFLLAALRSFVFRYNGDDEMTILMTDRSGSRTIVCGHDCEDTFAELLMIISNRIPPTIPSRCNNLSSEADPFIDDEGPDELFALPHFQVVDKTADGSRCFDSKVPEDSGVLDHQTSYNKATLLGLQVKLSDAPNSGWNLELHYDTLLYAHDSMERFWENFAVFLISLIADPSQSINTIPMCGQTEIAHLQRFYWNTVNTANSWQDMDICQRTLERSSRDPDKVAVTDSQGASISYCKLFERAKGVSSMLQRLGASPGDRICILMQPRVDLVVAVLGTMLARCCYVALETNFAPERMAFIVSDCDAYAVLHDHEASHLAKELTLKSNCSLHAVLVTHAALAKHDAMPINAVRESDPLYMVYTSGSTGRPKGLTISHANAQQMLASLDEYFRFSADDRFLQQTSLCFDLSVVQILSALSAGAQICIATAHLRQDPAALANFMVQSSVSVTYFTPTHFALLLEHGSESLLNCHRYRLALFAGEVLPMRVVKAFYNLKTPAVAYNAWGPSEPVVQTLVHKVEDSGQDEFDIPIGTPLPNCRHYITDAALNPLPAGLVGEICVGGPQVGLGYRNRPEENGRSFVQNPFCSTYDLKQGWTRLFRSGDKGRFRADGVLEFFGRVAGDNQLKLRGFRLDLTEIEHVLLRESSTISSQRLVHAVVAVTSRDDMLSSMTDDRQLIAFVVTSPILRSSTQQTRYSRLLHESIKPFLNEYMLPNGYQFMDELPTTVGGKIDRRRLLRAKLSLISPTSHSDAAGEWVAMTDGQDETLNCVIKNIKSVLGSGRRVSPNDNFFDLGGQSVQLLRLRKKLKKQFGVAPRLREMFQNSSPLEVSKMIDLLIEAHDGEPQPARMSNRSINWSQETALPGKGVDMSTLSRPRNVVSKVSKVLLTGVDTFQGVHMLAQLLSEQPLLHIHVIGQSRVISTTDLKNDMTRYGLFNEKLGGHDSEALARVFCVAGIMSAPQIGLSRDAFDSLADSVEAIYNFAADVSLMRPYSDLKPINTGAVLALINLACSNSTNVVQIHHLSTWSVPHIQTWKTTSRTLGTVNKKEESPSYFTPPNGEEHGYLKSRWVAEMLLTEASKRGVPVSIYRSSAIFGSFADDALPTSSLDFVSSLVSRCIRHNAVPCIDDSGLDGETDFAIDFVPVDVLTTAVSRLSAKKLQLEQGEPTIYHLGSSQPLPLRNLPDLIPAIRQSPEAVPGSPANRMPVQEWVEMVRDGCDENEKLFWVVFKEYLHQSHSMFALDRTKTDIALGQLDEPVVFPPIDAKHLAKWWARISRS